MKRYMSDVEVYFMGSMRHIRKTIYKENGLYYVKWYGNNVQVVQTRFGTWKTVEAYQDVAKKAEHDLREVTK